MKRINVLTAGHAYELHNFQEKDSDQDVSIQTLYFIHKEPVEGSETGELKTVQEGTTNEAVIEMLIDRITFLNEKMPCEENEKAISKLQGALDALESRTAGREAREVEGKNEA